MLIIRRGLKWYLIDILDKKHIWTPQIYFGKATDTIKSVSTGDEKLSYLWFNSIDHYIIMADILLVTISCGMDFEKFPYDSHNCQISLKNWLGRQDRLQLRKPKLFTRSENGTEIQQSEIKLEKDRLNFDFEFKVLEPTKFTAISEDYSMVQIEMNLTRSSKSRTKIFISFFVPTGIFTALSFISYFVPPDSVPGRMGMLITLYLILVNTYNNVEAPDDRGLSKIEQWYLSLQAAIITAIVEYGIILAMKMFHIPTMEKCKFFGKPMSRTSLFKTMDAIFFIISSLYFIILNVCYWDADWIFKTE